MDIKTKSYQIFSSKAFHIGLLVIGAIFMLSGAFHDNIWFDESYSVGIASHSFAEIWNYGSGDVHPVLYYYALHIIHLLGGGLTAYRIFTVCGALALATLGFTHLRRDFGWETGVLFTFFALFTPYVSFLAIEVRMYSWASCMVMLAFIYAFRISRNKSDSSDSPTQRATTHNWILFSLCSLAAAYLHYFSLMCAFIINLGLLIFLIFHRRERKQDLRIFWIQAIVQVICYTPWLFALASQLGVVSNTYWAKFQFPGTLISLIRYPVITMQIDFAWTGDYGIGPVIIVWAIVIAAIFLAISIARGLYHYIKRQRTIVRKHYGSEPWYKRVGAFIARPENLPGFLGLGVYLGLFVMAALASMLMHSFMVYFRYMFCAIGPLFFALACLLHRIGNRSVSIAACTLLFCLGLLNQALIVQDDYSPDNQAPIDYLEDNVAEGELVLSSDIGIEGVTACELPDIPQDYLDWQPGNWKRAYMAYSPTLTSIPTWETVLNDYHGKFWVLGQSTNGSRPTDVDDLDAEDDIEVVSSQVFYRPYERSYFTITLMDKE